jgi:hypothetical protein
VPEQAMVRDERALRERRDQLARYGLEREQAKNHEDSVRVEAQERLAELLKHSDSAPASGRAAELDAQIRQAREDRDRATEARDLATVQADLADQLIKAIDAFFIAIHTISQGATRSPFVSAALHERIREGGPGVARYDAVLYIKGSGGSVDQLLEKVFIAKDRVEVVASVSISYWAMDPETSNIVAAGTVTASSRLSGKLGEELSLSPITA